MVMGSGAHKRPRTAQQPRGPTVAAPLTPPGRTSAGAAPPGRGRDVGSQLGLRAQSGEGPERRAQGSGARGPARHTATFSSGHFAAAAPGRGAGPFPGGRGGPGPASSLCGRPQRADHTLSASARSDAPRTRSDVRTRPVRGRQEGRSHAGPHGGRAAGGGASPGSLPQRPGPGQRATGAPSRASAQKTPSQGRWGCQGDGVPDPTEDPWGPPSPAPGTTHDAFHPELSFKAADCVF